MTEIVGIFLLRNEDVFIEQCVRNVVEFCDRIIVADNYSTDNTWPILKSLSREFPKIEASRIRHPQESHDLIAGLAGSDTWVFGVDGDEIYDPVGLKRFRSMLLSGAYDSWWSIFGNVLNVTEIDLTAGTASGYLAPPSRSITKLYNFGALERWDGPCPERLHGGTPVFRQGYHADLRLELHCETSWEQADYRCLHVCFIRRSSREAAVDARMNPAELNAQGWGDRIKSFFFKAKHRDTGSEWKKKKYMRGELAEFDVRAFFPFT